MDRVPLAGGSRGGTPPPARTGYGWAEEEPERYPTVRRQRTGLIQYVRESVAVSAGITMPGRREIGIYSAATLVLMVATMGLVASIDVAWSAAALFVFGR